MNKIIIPTPEGGESVYDTVILARFELLKEKVAPLIESFSSLPVTVALTERMIPTAQTAWESGAAESMVYVEVTPDRLTGFGLSVSLKELPHMPPLSTPMECWGFAVALAESLRLGLPASCEVKVCPLYVENALNVAVENRRMTVGLWKDVAPEK